MPPKKAVKEEKILLGRPGNNLKSGIVCLFPRCCMCFTNALGMFRSALQMLANRRFSSQSPSAPSGTLQTFRMQPSTPRKHV